MVPSTIDRVVRMAVGCLCALVSVVPLTAQGQERHEQIINPMELQRQHMQRLAEESQRRRQAEVARVFAILEDDGGPEARERFRTNPLAVRRWLQMMDDADQDRAFRLLAFTEAERMAARIRTEAQDVVEELAAPTGPLGAERFGPTERAQLIAIDEACRTYWGANLPGRFHVAHASECFLTGVRDASLRALAALPEINRPPAPGERVFVLTVNEGVLRAAEAARRWSVGEPARAVTVIETSEDHDLAELFAWVQYVLMESLALRELTFRFDGVAMARRAYGESNVRDAAEIAAILEAHGTSPHDPFGSDGGLRLPGPAAQDIVSRLRSFEDAEEISMAYALMLQGAELREVLLPQLAGALRFDADRRLPGVFFDPTGHAPDLRGEVMEEYLSEVMWIAEDYLEGTIGIDDVVDDQLALTPRGVPGFVLHVLNTVSDDEIAMIMGNTDTEMTLHQIETAVATATRVLPRLDRKTFKAVCRQAMVRWYAAAGNP